MLKRLLVSMASLLLGCNLRGGGNDIAVDFTGWQTLQAMPLGPRQQVGAAAVGGLVYVVGGLDPYGTALDRVERFDPLSNRWVAIAPLPIPMYDANVGADDQFLYVAGGFTSATAGASGRTFRYDPAADAWTELEPMPAGSERAAAGVAIFANVLYVIGGNTGGSHAAATTDVSALELTANTWQEITPLPQPRDHLAAAAYNGVLYAIGGLTGSTFLADADAYSLAVHTWVPQQPMTIPRAYAAAAQIGSTILVFGGQTTPSQATNNSANATSVVGTVEVFDPSQNLWSESGSMRTPRQGLGAAAVDGTVYLPGGSAREGLAPVSVLEAYRPR